MVDLESIENPVEVYLYVRQETELSYLVMQDEDDYGSSTYIPKSQIYCEDEISINDSFVIVMPEWLAIKKGFV